MKKKTQKIKILLILMVVVCYSIMPLTSVKVYAATSHTADEAIAWVDSQIGSAVGTNASNTGECVGLISAYYNYLGQTTPSYYNAKELKDTASSQPSGWQVLQGVQPQKGDIIIYDCNTGPGHVAIYDSDNVTYHQNFSSRTVQKVEMYYQSAKADCCYYWGVVRPDFKQEVQGYVDEVSSNADGKLTVRGWAFDPSNTSANLEINVYIGEEGHNFNANVERSDINSAYSIDGNHGFAETMDTNLTGTQTITIYAHDAAKESGKVLYSGSIDIKSHTGADAVNENEKEPTCTEEGSYDEVIYCSNCGAELSRTSKTVEATGHTEADVVEENKVEATCSKEGSYDEVVYCSVCGEELSRTSKTIEATGHTEGKTVKENVVEATTEKEGSYDEVVYCSVCGEELSRKTITTDKLEGVETTSNSATEASSTPNTGDTSNLILWIGGVAVFGALSLIILKTKKSSGKRSK